MTKKEEKAKAQQEMMTFTFEVHVQQEYVLLCPTPFCLCNKSPIFRVCVSVYGC